jgi:putative ABC transport system substrate-binding protein
MQFDPLRRRQFITLLGCAAVAWPLAARAQQPAPVIGFLSSYAPDAFGQRVAAAFRQGLGETGYVEGRNVTIESRWAAGEYDRLPALAADLVRRQVAVIAATGGATSARAAKAATTTIPIVFSTAGDPVELGLVAGLSRPSGNLTGVTNLNMEVGPKRLELVHNLVPAAATIALLVNPTNNTAEAQLREMQAAARTLGVQLQVLRASTEREIDDAFAVLTQLRTGGLVIAADPFFNGLHEQLAALALRHGVAAVYLNREFAAAGGLASYTGGSTIDNVHQVGVYTGRILKGEKPGDLPVQQSTKTELVINLRTAKALGLAVSTNLLAIADEVIE